MVHVSGTTKEYVVCTRMARQLVTIRLPVVSTVPAVHQYTCNIQGTEASSGAAAAKTRLSLSNEASDDLTIRRRTKKKKKSTRRFNSSFIPDPIQKKTHHPSAVYFSSPVAYHVSGIHRLFTYLIYRPLLDTSNNEYVPARKCRRVVCVTRDKSLCCCVRTQGRCCLLYTSPSPRD